MKKAIGFTKQMISVMLVLALVLILVPTSASAAKKAKLNKTKVTLKVGKTVTLKLKNNKKKVKWTSSNKKVATVTSKGKVKAKKAGKTTITAKVGKKKYKCKVTVQAKKSTTKINNNNDNDNKTITPTVNEDYTSEEFLASCGYKFLKVTLLDPNSLEIDDIGWFTSANNRSVVCIDFRAKNAFGGYVSKCISISDITEIYNNDNSFSFTYIPEGIKQFITITPNTAPRRSEFTSVLNVSKVLRCVTRKNNIGFSIVMPEYSTLLEKNDPINNVYK